MHPDLAIRPSQPDGTRRKPFQQWFGRHTRENAVRAEYKLREYRNKIADGTFGIPQSVSQATIAEACDLFYELHGKTLGSWRDIGRVLRDVKQFWANRTIDGITFRDVEKYREWRKSLGNAESTVNRQQMIITSMFSKLTRWVKTGEIDRIKLPETNPGSLVPKASETERVRRRVLSVEEFERLMAVATRRGHDIYLMAVNSLLRKKDLEGLQKECINEHTGEIRGLQSKTGTPYSVVINKWIAQVLSKARSGPVLDFTNFQKEFNDARKKARILDFEFRDLRRPGATRMLKDGADLATISQMLGHTSIQMTERYIGIVKEDKKRAAELLASPFKPMNSSTSGDANG